MNLKSFCLCLGLLLIGLRLAGAISWPWWAVLAPIWGWLAFATALVVAVAVREAWESPRVRRALERRRAERGRGRK